jgi:glycosyltransferase involved in cell wall biosynthesis
VSALTVSVVMPVRDGARYLAEALESVLGQVPVPFELIVVDDGSTDSTPDVLGAYVGAVRVIRQSASGQPAALNRGIGEASGTVVGFCDADDRWVAGRLARQVAALQRAPGVDIVGGAVEEFLSPDALDIGGTVRVTTGAVRARLLGALLARREVLDRVGNFDPSLRHGSGIDWISRADALGVRLEWIDSPVLQRRVHAANLGHETDIARADLLRVIRRDRQRRADSSASAAADGADP